MLSVYKGSALTTLTPVAANDDFSGTHQSRVAFQMTAGATYYVQLAGWKGAQGRYRLSFAPPARRASRTRKASLAE